MVDVGDGVGDEGAVVGDRVGAAVLHRTPPLCACDQLVPHEHKPKLGV